MTLWAWSDKALREQREINRKVDALAATVSGLQLPHFLPTPVVAAETIPAGGSGVCKFQQGTLNGERSLAGKAETMYNICSGSPIQAQEEALAFRVTLIGGEGGWVVMRPCKCTGGVKPEYDCEQCANRKMPTVSLRITGLEDLAGNSTFDGWGAAVDGTWDLSHEPPFSACNPGLFFTVPDNRPEDDDGNPTGKTGSPFISGKFALRFAAVLEGDVLPRPAIETFGRPLNQIWFMAGDVADTLGLVADSEVDLGLYPIEGYRESTATPMTDDGGTPVPRVICTQTYSTYDHVDRGVPNNPFKTWLDQGTFEINP